MSEEEKLSPEEQKNMKTFMTVWVGQVVSLLGSGLTSFALGIWVLQNTDSVTQYTIIAVIAGLPALLAAPLIGALVDRWDRRTILILTDLGAGITTLAICALLYNDALEVWHIYISVAINAFFGSFQWPAFISSMVMIVPRAQFGRVNGLLQFGQAGTTIAAPALAGLLMFQIGIWGVLLLDVFSFLFAIGALLMVKLPRPAQSEEGKKAKGSIWKEAAVGWTFIKERPALLHLLAFFAAINLFTSMAGISIIPMVLRTSGGNEAAAGTVMSAVGIGMLIGSLYMSTTGGPKKRIHGVLGFGMLFSGFMFLAGITPAIWFTAIAVALWHANIPIINGCSTVIWQEKTPADIQGRVFAVRRMIAQFTVPLGDFSAGPLSDYVFEPMMAEGGALADSVGSIIGVGPGRGIALLIICAAIFPALIAAVGYMSPKIRNIETDLPDATHEAEQQAPASDATDDEAEADGATTDDDAESSDAADEDNENENDDRG